METQLESQNKRIKKHLESGKSLTGMDALYMFGSWRLSARIYDLKQAGLNIETDMVKITSPSVYTGTKKVARYKIVK